MPRGLDSAFRACALCPACALHPGPYANLTITIQVLCPAAWAPSLYSGATASPPTLGATQRPLCLFC